MNRLINSEKENGVDMQNNLSSTNVNSVDI